MSEQEKQRICIQTGERIRRFREELGITKERLAEAADISTQYVNDIELGRKCMGFTILASIAAALHVDMETLVYGRPKGDEAVSRAMDYLKELTPVERDMAASMLLHAARTAMALGPEEREEDW